MVCYAATMSIEDRLPGIMKQIGKVPRYCETPLPNADCPYMNIGCYACSNKAHPEVQRHMEEDCYKNKVYGLPREADGIDRRAYLAGQTREQAEERFCRENEVRVYLQILRDQHCRSTGFWF